MKGLRRGGERVRIHEISCAVQLLIAHVGGLLPSQRRFAPYEIFPKE